MRLRDIALAVILTILGGCYRPLPTYRYRLTVEVDTPSGPKRGSSVIEIRSTDKGAGFPGPEAGGVDQDVIGEAVPVELANGVTLFALLTRPGNNEYAGGLIPQLNSDMPSNVSAEDRLNEFKRRRYPMPVPRWRDRLSWEKDEQPLWPMFVVFRDVTNPASVVEVDLQNPEAALGARNRIVSVTAQITDDPVTHNVPKYLPWITDRKISYFNGKFSDEVQSRDVAAHLNRSSFVRAP